MMKYWPIKLIPDVKMHGGKTYLCRRIFNHAPPGYTRFLDGFMGGGSMTYNAPMGLEEQVACETNWDRWNVKMVIKGQWKELYNRLCPVLYNEETFQKYKKLGSDQSSPMFSAVRYVVVSRMSRGGLGQDFAWSDRERGGQPGDVNAWLTMISRLKYLSERLQGVTLFNHSYRRTLSEVLYNPAWFVYLDPTYHPDCRVGNGGEYGDDEMNHYNHKNLVDLVAGASCKIAISHYKHELYESLGWRSVSFDMPNHSGQGSEKQRRTEKLYMNYEA